MSRKNKYPRRKSLLYINQTDDALKQVCFWMPESAYLQLRADMQVDDIRTINDFMCELIRLYLEKDEDMLFCINKVKEVITRQSYTRKTKLAEEYLKGNELIKKFNILDEEERENLFDIIEGDISEDELSKA